MALCSVVYFCRVKRRIRVQRCDSDTLLNSHWRLRASIWNTFRYTELIRMPLIPKAASIQPHCAASAFVVFCLKISHWKANNNAAVGFALIIWLHIRRDIITNLKSSFQCSQILISSFSDAIGFLCPVSLTCWWTG